MPLIFYSSGGQDQGLQGGVVEEAGLVVYISA